MKITLLVGLAFLLLCFPEHSAASRSDNPRKSQSWIGLTKQVFIIGAWQPYLKTVNDCSNFRQDTTPALFKVWPEEDGEFCCEDGLTNQTIASYVFSEIDGRFLQPIVYYDVGIVDDFTPFWRSWRFDRISQKDITNLAYCEVNDLKRFYVRRFWREVIVKQGLYSGVLFILVVEILVLLSALPQLIKSKLSSRSRVAPAGQVLNPRSVLARSMASTRFPRFYDLKRFYVRRFWREVMAKQGLLHSGMPFILLVEILLQLSALPQLIKSKLSSRSRVVPADQARNPRPVLARSMASKSFPRLLGWETTWDLVHLLFLGVNGSLLMEAVGHSDPCGWEAVLLYNSAVVYTYLTLLSIICALLQQTALWSRAMTNDRLRRVEQMALEKIVEDADWKVERHKIEKEWQIQRISTQCTVVLVGSLYCTFVSIYPRNEFVAWLLGIIFIALVWSFIVGFAMLSKAWRLRFECWRQGRVARKRELELAAQTARRRVNL